MPPSPLLMCAPSFSPPSRPPASCAPPPQPTHPQGLRAKKPNIVFTVSPYDATWPAYLQLIKS